MNIPGVYIRSVGTALPGPPIDNARLARRFEMSALWSQWVDVFVGTHSRHLAVDLDTGEVRFSLADLGETAARQALRRAGLEAGAVDLVVMATSTPDALMPATINIVADRLGLNDLPTYQLQSGCTGAIQAIDVACQMLMSGRGRTALVLGGDVAAKHYDLTIDLNSVPPAQQVNGLLFGDGAGAAVLSTQRAPGSARIRHRFVRFTGLHRPPGQTVEWFGLADRSSGLPGGSEDYKAIEESVPVMAVEILDELLDEVGWRREELAYLLPPQLSGRMTARITERLAVPGAVEITCVHETGNTGNAMPFFQLERTLPKATAGDRSVMIAVEASKWLKAGVVLEAT